MKDPAKLIGEWSQGMVPDDVFDPASGRWSTVGSDGFLWRFTDGGSYEYMGALSVGEMTIASYERGTVSIERNRFTVQPEDRWVLQPDGRTERHPQQALGHRRYSWRLLELSDATQLVLEDPDGKADSFHRPRGP